MRQATRAPVAALEPSTVSAAHRSAWASMPTATGQAQHMQRRGEEDAVGSDGDAGGDHVLPQRARLCRPGRPAGRRREAPVQAAVPSRSPATRAPHRSGGRRRDGSRPLMRSNAPLSTCGPGTRTMHGQTATRRSDELNWNRTASAPITPASNAAQNGCRKTFALYWRQAAAQNGAGRRAHEYEQPPRADVGHRRSPPAPQRPPPPRA